MRFLVDPTQWFGASESAAKPEVREDKSANQSAPSPSQSPTKPLPKKEASRSKLAKPVKKESETKEQEEVSEGKASGEDVDGWSASGPTGRAGGLQRSCGVLARQCERLDDWSGSEDRWRTRGHCLSAYFIA